MKPPTAPHKSRKIPQVVSARGSRYSRIVDKTAPKAIGHIRVSTELQAADGISLDAQRESLEPLARLGHLAEPSRRELRRSDQHSLLNLQRRIAEVTKSY